MSLLLILMSLIPFVGLEHKRLSRHRLLVTFTLVKRIGIAFFSRLHFFGFSWSFRIFGYNIWSAREANAPYMVWCNQIYTPHNYWANLVQKFKIVSLSCNLAPRLIQICRSHWSCSLFLFSTENTIFRQI